MKDEKTMAHDPLSDADSILSEEYYGRRADVPIRAQTKGHPAAAADPLQGDLHLDVHAPTSRDLDAKSPS